MRLSYIFFSFFILLSTFGCSSNNSQSNGVKESSVTVDVNGSVNINFSGSNTKELTLNSEVVSIEISVIGSDNTPYSDGEVFVVYPDKVQTGVDVGSFENTTVSITKGKATFTYTGPKDLQSLVDKNDVSTVFGFYHSSSPLSVKDYTLTYSPIANQTVLETYSLKSSLQDTNVTIGLESSKLASFYVEDNTNNRVEDSKMVSLTVEVLNQALIELEDTLGNSGDKLVATADNEITLQLKTNTISGVVPIKATAVFKDVNDKETTISEVFNLVVLSGPPTAISISYVSTGQDEEYAKFQESLVVTVTDKYFNLVNTNPAITTGVIAGYARDITGVRRDVSGSRIYHEPDSATTATLNASTKKFSANNGMDFSFVDEDNDVLAVFGLGYSYDASGKWDFTTVGTSSSNELMITDDYDSNVSRSNLGFAIGNNFRQDQCRPLEWLGTIKVADGSSKLDSRGMAKLTLEYDYYLTGKDVVVWVNLVGFTAQTGTKGKVGEAIKHTLRGNGLEAVVVPVTDGDYRVKVLISGTTEWYRNSRFGYDLKPSDNIQINSSSSSNADILDCSQLDGIAYVNFNVTSKDGKAGTVSVLNILPSAEF